MLSRVTATALSQAQRVASTVDEKMARVDEQIETRVAALRRGNKAAAPEQAQPFRTCSRRVPPACTTAPLLAIPCDYGTLSCRSRLCRTLV